MNQWEVHPGLPHWMDLADAVSIPFMQSHERDPVPAKVVWHQSEVPHTRFYWLAVESTEADEDDLVVATYRDQTITVVESRGVQNLTIRLTDAMVDMNLPVQVVHGDAPLVSATVPRTIAVLARTLDERGDPELMFSGELQVALSAP